MKSRRPFALLCLLSILLAGRDLSAQSVLAANQVPDVSQTPGELIRRAFDANRDLAAARLDLERGRARLRQAGLRPNPTLDVEHTSGRLIGSPGEQELSVGVALPLEIGPRRRGRIDVAMAELAVTEAEVSNRERELARDVLVAYVEAVAANRELETTQRLHQLDQDMVRVVLTRVEEKDAPQLELNLLLTEVARLDARRALLQGRTDAALIKIAQLIGTPQERVSVSLTASGLDPSQVPASVEAATDLALNRRADILVAKLNQEAAEAGVRLAKAEAWPELTVSGAYRRNRGVTELPAPLVALPDGDQVVAVGASVGLPFFNRNQGARAEAAVGVRQARLRRESAEQTVRAEVAIAFRRAEAAQTALRIFENGFLKRADDNIRVMRAAYELGEFRITDVITEQRRVLEAQQEYTEALTERYRAVVDLRAAIGLTGVSP